SAAVLPTPPSAPMSHRPTRRAVIAELMPKVGSEGGIVFFIIANRQAPCAGRRRLDPPAPASYHLKTVASLPHSPAKLAHDSPDGIRAWSWTRQASWRQTPASRRVSPG